jgi:hypothetical protein
MIQAEADAVGKSFAARETIAAATGLNNKAANINNTQQPFYQ